MAPILISSLDVPSEATYNKVSIQRFPDGIKTSGQHPPLYNQLQSYELFPRGINGPTVWKKEDYEQNPERWTHRFTEMELAELSDAADRFEASGVPLTAITKLCG